MMRCCHLFKFESAKYPEKLCVLRGLGLDMPELIQDLIIDPRNLSEHEYGTVSIAEAKRAVELCSLFLSATSGDQTHMGNVARGLIFHGQFNYCIDKGHSAEFSAMRKSPFAFVDVLTEDESIMVVDPECGRIYSTPFDKLNRQQNLEIARYFFKAQRSFASSFDRVGISKAKRIFGF